MPGIEIVYLCFGHGRVFVDSGGRWWWYENEKWGHRKNGEKAIVSR